ncbi:HEAT repeat domain-containing protein [Gemmatimonas groenlandica]|uniref:HEAT repeat domain-containing protein n=1 Tax=Gemmatimonas groenlandica TaxID=2732249 RepID=A0A6M4IUC2_9BACT|nr:hypothetical protein [Gemmatimonas groenlandica]QJR37086.1 hypothetical protein HKW67_16955 [Gemmatimonas groenlandica]
MPTDSDGDAEQARLRSLTQSIASVLRTFVRANRATQMYLPNSAMRPKARDDAREAFRAFWLQESELSLTITEQSLLAGDREVYREDERTSAALPWLLYRDGLRRLDLHPGFEDAELDTLLDILQQARDASSDDDDLVTQLWLADFQKLTFRNVELLTDFDAAYVERDPGEVASGGYAGVPSAVQLIESPPLGDGPPPRLIHLDDDASTLHFLDPQEAIALQAAIRREYANDGLPTVLDSLFDIVEVQEDDEVRAEVCDILDRLLLNALSAEEYPVVACILRDTRAALARADWSDEIRRALSALAARLNAASAIDGLISAVERGAFAAAPVTLEPLLEGLGYDALVPLVAWFADAPLNSSRQTVEGIVTRQLAARLSLLQRLLEDPREPVVRGAILFARQVASPALVAPLAKLFREGADSTRSGAASALAAIASPTAMDVLQSAIAHELRDVRLAALKAIAATRYRQAFPRLVRDLDAKALRRVDLSEKRAFVEALAAAGGDDATAPLDAMLNGRGLLGYKEAPELRMCAAYGLGMIGTERATRSLQRAADTSDPMVRRAISQAMRGTP